MSDIRTPGEEAAAAADAQARIDALAAEFPIDKLAAVHDVDWWASASREDVGSMIAIAGYWKDQDSRAADAGAIIEREAFSRYGIDLASIGVDLRPSESTIPEAVRLARADQARPATAAIATSTQLGSRNEFQARTSRATLTNQHDHQRGN